MRAYIYEHLYEARRPPVFFSASSSSSSLFAGGYRATGYGSRKIPCEHNFVDAPRNGVADSIVSQAATAHGTKRDTVTFRCKVQCVQ